jgi:hypothetical protein
MEFNQRFALNEPTVIQEIIDGEAIIADLSRGFYYSLDSVGSQVWDALVSGCSQSEIVDVLAAQFSADRGSIAQGIAGLLERLMQEELLVPLDTAGALVNRAPEILAGISVNTFTAPVLSKYTDMEQLMLLDPIHDVDETGWPNELGDTSENPVDKASQKL